MNITTKTRINGWKWICKWHAGNRLGRMPQCFPRVREKWDSSVLLYFSDPRAPSISYMSLSGGHPVQSTMDWSQGTSQQWNRFKEMSVGWIPPGSDMISAVVMCLRFQQEFCWCVHYSVLKRWMKTWYCIPCTNILLWFLSLFFFCFIW